MRKKLLWIFLIAPLILSVSAVNMIGVTVAQEEKHDVAVTRIALTRGAAGEFVNVTVVVKNNGTVSETFNVTLYYDDTPIETQNVTDLASGANNTLLFAWNTAGVLARTYAVKAVASEVEGETNTANNMLTSSIAVEIKSKYITVAPQSNVDTTLTPGMNYTVSIYTDYNGTDVWGYEFTLTYNPLVLQGLKVTNGDLITKEKGPSADFIPGPFNNTLGKLTQTTAFFYFTDKPAPLTSGPGTLANITFRVVSLGDSNITLGTEVLIPSRLIGYTDDGYGDEYNIIDDVKPDRGHILHGHFRNTAEPVTHDIAVNGVTPSPTSVVRGESVNVTVVVENQGTVTETFNVEAYYDYDPNFPTYRRIGTQTAESLAAGENQTLTFTWDTTGVVVGNHTITAVASKLPGETDTDDNTLQSDQVVEVMRRGESPIPIELIIGVAVAVIAVIAVATFALRRRKKPTPE